MNSLGGDCTRHVFFTIANAYCYRYTHLGVTEELGGGYELEMRAEVGLLSRNVRVMGARDTQWSDDIVACRDGFDTGMCQAHDKHMS